MHQQAAVFLTLGLLLLAGLVVFATGRRLGLPRLTLLLLLGVTVGPAGLDLLPAAERHWLVVLAQATLILAVFLLGVRINLAVLRQTRPQALILTAALTLGTTVIVAGGLAAWGVSAHVSLLLAAVTSATAAGSVADVLGEGQVGGPFARLAGEAASLDDVYGVVLFALLGAAAPALAGGGVSPGVIWTVAGAGLLGGGVGAAMAWRVNHLRGREANLVETLGWALLSAGLADLLKVSPLLTVLILGMTGAGLTRSRFPPFRVVEGVLWPLLVLLFISAGALFQPEALPGLAALVIVYGLTRVVGRVAGGWIGARACRGLTPVERRWLGTMLLPHSGLAVGLALAARQEWPEVGDVVLSVVVGGVIALELVYPLAARIALDRVGSTQIGEIKPP